MIDLKNEDQKYYYLGKCITGKTIDFYSEKIYQPLVNDIFEMGEKSYFQLLMPFIIPIDFFKNSLDSTSVYEAIMQDEGMTILLKESLFYFLKLDKDDIKEYYSERKKRKQLLIKDRLILYNERFDELKTLVLLMCNVKELTKEDLELGKKDEEPLSASKKKLLNGRKQNNKYNLEDKKVKLVNVYNYIVHEPPIPDYDKYLNWSIYQLYNTYSNMMKKKNIQFTYDVITNGMGTKEMKLESLADQIIK